MLLSALFAVALSQADVATQIDEMAKARDVAGLTKFLAPFQGRNPLSPITTGGAYDTGRFGWRAILLRMGAESFIVFSTRLTSEDVGELLFRWQNGKLVYVPEDYTNGQRIASHDIELSFNIATKQAILKDTIELQFVGRRTLPPMIRIGPNYKVSKITDAQGQDVAFLQAGGIIAFPGLNNTEKLTLEYRGTVDKPEFAGSITNNEAILTNDYWYPMVARQPAPYTLTVKAPKAWIAVGQGEKLAETVAGEVKTTKFKMDMPVVYYSFSAAPYRFVEGTTKGKKYRMWSATLTPEQMAIQNELFPPIIETFSRISPYPFSGFGAVFTPAYGGGALEAYSFATYGTGLPDEEPHEPAHTWWGGMVNNSYLHSLWNESFAVFCEGWYRRNSVIGNRAERALAFIDTPDTPGVYKAAPLSQGSPFIGPAASSLGYGKGGFVLQMLEQEIGPDLMLQSMQEWIRVQPKTRSGEWEDYEAAVARVHRGDLRWFFDQWVRRAGWVDFDITNLKWDGKGFTGKIAFKSEPYILNAEVMLENADGTRSFTTVPLSNASPRKEQSFTIPVKTKPRLVSIDPWRRILRPIAANEAPVSLLSELEDAKRYTDPAHAKYLASMSSGQPLRTLPSDLNGVFLVGHPDTLAVMRGLCEKVGFEVKGDSLTYKGTTIDLKKGAALAVVELGNGKRCVIGLGQTRRRPHTGRARLVLTDDLGRFLRGQTEPKTSGNLTFRDF